MRTLEGVYLELGEDWRRQLRQRAVERSVARQLENEFQLHEGELIKAALDAVKASAKPVAEDREEEELEEEEAEAQP
jgi:hypothetical protein